MSMSKYDYTGYSGQSYDRNVFEAVCQKVDLLCASRSNLFSNTLVPYQNEIMKFWEKTAHTLAAVLENIKDYQHYEFKLLKGLNPMQDLEVGDEENEKKQTQEEEGEQKHGDNQLISLDELGGELANDLFERGIHDLDSERVTDKDEEKNADQDNGNLLLGEINETDFQEPTKEDLDLWNDILGEENDTNTGKLEEQWHSVFGEFSFARPQSTKTPISPPQPPANNDLVMLDNNPEQPKQPQATTGGYLPSQLMDMMMT
uniref:AH domain-containing protein n=1 Tax=Ciona savignyi TaxID=51511 RepID=H2ZC37_CIOSA